MMGRKIAWILSLAVLLYTGVVGIYDGITEWTGTGTLLQKSVTGGVFLYGVVGLIATFLLFQRRRWSVAASIVWGVIVTYVGGAATIAYGGQDASLASAIAASGAAALIALGVVWTAKAVTRDAAFSAWSGDSSGSE
jgi:hypothetical protein